LRNPFLVGKGDEIAIDGERGFFGRIGFIVIIPLPAIAKSFLFPVLVRKNDGIKLPEKFIDFRLGEFAVFPTGIACSPNGNLLPFFRIPESGKAVFQYNQTSIKVRSLVVEAGMKFMWLFFSKITLLLSGSKRMKPVRWLPKNDFSFNRLSNPLYLSLKSVSCPKSR
jgi:hypothetical protein